MTEIAPLPGNGAGALRPNFCPSCGVPAAAAGDFCTACGSSLTVPEPRPVSAAVALGCRTCGGDGRRLAQDKVFCPECRWLRPLIPGYAMPVEAYLWASDAQAMGVLAGIAPLNAAARSISTRFSRPWFEASVNGVRLGPDQVPDVFELGVRAARTLGLPRMPELYVSGEQMWEAMTLGDAADAFIVIGSVLTNFQKDDLLFALAREMGHAAAGHGLWRAVVQFVSGKHSARNLMAEGVLKYLNPAKLVESAVDVPLMAWMRHAEITADRAGALAVGDEAVCRRVLTQWTIRSFPLYARLNQAALDRQLAEQDVQAVQAAEWTASASPFLSRRLRLLREFVASETFAAFHAPVRHWAVEVPRLEAQARVRAEIDARRTPDAVRLNCVACGEPMRLDRSALEGRTEAKVHCPNPRCGKVLEIAPIPPNRAEVTRIETPPDTVRLTCAPPAISRCGFRNPLSPPAAPVNVRCPNPDCLSVLTVSQTDGGAPDGSHDRSDG